ncbi:Copalyl diphosphate synthase [Venturia inaequalis]|nr:Copalyl diphosphate synthase [Venturia inaequalis]
MKADWGLSAGSHHKVSGKSCTDKTLGSNRLVDGTGGNDKDRGQGGQRSRFKQVVSIGGLLGTEDDSAQPAQSDRQSPLFTTKDGPDT